MTPKTIAFSAGHTPKNPGATRGNMTEYSLTSQIVGRCIRILSEKGHYPYLIGTNSNENQIKAVNELNAACGMEIHFNSFFSDDMNGTETLHAGSTKGMRLAQHIQNNLLNRLKTKDRGIKKGWYRGDLSKGMIPMLVETNCPFVIVEPLFLSHLDDSSKLDLEIIAVAICDGVEMYLETLTG